jgi:hypothetical protein
MFTEKIDGPGEVDWDLWRRVDEIAHELIPEGTGHYSGQWGGGETATCQNFEELSQDARGKRVSSLRFSRSSSDGLRSIGLNHWPGAAYGNVTDIEVTAESRAQAVAMAHPVRQEVAVALEREKERKEAAAREKEASRTTPAVPATNRAKKRQGRVRTLLSSPNPWVLAIGGAVIAGILVGLFTNWFGLG